MCTRSKRLVLGAAVTLAVGFVSCDRGPTSPTSPPSARLRLEVVAPREIAPGESVQLTANIVKSDGSVENVTGRAQWTVQSVPTSSVLVTERGLATGADRGEGLVTARFASLTADATIFVLPKGTFRLAGRITGGGVGLENVTVTVIAGIGEGLTARTNVSGEYELYGVAGLVQLRASKDGYFDRAQEVEVTAHGSLTFEMTTGRPENDYAGAYTLILTAGSCTPRFPEEGKRRVYAARMEQSGGDLRVSLSGADFWPGSGVFAGATTPTGEIKFIIRPEWAWDYDAFDLIERLSDGTSVIVQGAILASRTPAGITGTRNSDFTDGNALHIRLNRNSSGWCLIERFEMVPR